MQLEGLILLIPRLLLTRPKGGNFRRHLTKRFEMFYEGNFEELLRPPEDQQHMQMREEGDYDARAHF